MYTQLKEPFSPKCKEVMAKMVKEHYGIGDFRFTTFIEDIKSIMRDHPQPPDALQREALEGLGIPHEA
jgi:hypothetical protein